MPGWALYTPAHEIFVKSGLTITPQTGQIQIGTPQRVRHMRLSRLLIGVLFWASASQASANEQIRDWWITVEDSSEQLTVLAFTRSDDGHAFAIGQTQEGPIKAAILINNAQLRLADQACCVEAQVMGNGDSPIISTYIRPGAQRAQQDRETLEWALWQPGSGEPPSALVQALMRGDTVSLRVEDDFGELHQLSFSLKGAGDALRWMITQGPMTITHDTVDTLTQIAAHECRGGRAAIDHCFDNIVSCWDRQHEGASALAFHGCLRVAGVMGPPRAQAAE